MINRKGTRMDKDGEDWHRLLTTNFKNRVSAIVRRIRQTRKVYEILANVNWGAEYRVTDLTLYIRFAQIVMKCFSYMFRAKAITSQSAKLLHTVICPKSYLSWSRITSLLNMVSCDLFL